ncbi:uncharacterized protein LOC135465742 [Liolophura sinensis]|uniref:uncharacterized protein LOC135465742 n=1 Tax=Liolophura sinensis TaxID=3198878 RepID=UPI003158A5C3
MEGLGGRCRETDRCSGNARMTAHYRRTVFVERENGGSCEGVTSKPMLEEHNSESNSAAKNPALRGVNASSAMGCSSGRVVRRNPNVADFYCPIADSMEWIDGQDSPVPSPPKELGTYPENETPSCEAQIENVEGFESSSSESIQAVQIIPLTNGLHSKNSVVKPGKQHRRSLLSCASHQSPDLALADNTMSASHNSHAALTEIRIGNSCFYVPSALCSNNMATRTVNSEHFNKNGRKHEKYLKSIDKCKLPNGLTFGSRDVKLVNGSSSNSRKSWPNSESSHRVRDRGSESSHKKKGIVSSSVSVDRITSLQNNQEVQAADSAKTNMGSVCEEVKCRGILPVFLHTQEVKGNELCNNNERECKVFCAKGPGSGLENCPEDCNIHANKHDECVNTSSCVPRNNSSESSEMLDFYDDGVFLEERSPLGENGDPPENYGACGVCDDSVEDLDRSQCLESRTCNNTESFCDIEVCNSSYNFLATSVSPSASIKYCEKNKELEKVLFAGACSAGCDNNDDIGDFIEADIPQHVDRLSSPGGSRASTSSNDEDNILSCQDLNKVGNSSVNIECWDNDKYEDKSAFVDDDITDWCHHPQEADLGRDGVFFSYAPNHNPSLIPGLFRRDTRNCFGRWMGGSLERKPTDLLSDVSAHRQCQRPRGRSDSSSIAKQSSSDSEISNLAFSDSSLLVSPEVDMMGFDLMVTNSDLDRIGHRDGIGVNGGGCDASSGTLRRNSSEEGFHEALEEELGACFISGAHASGNCCCPNDLSGSSPLQSNGHSANQVSPSAAATDSHSLNLQVHSSPCFHRYEDNKEDGDEACVLTYDETHRAKPKAKSHRRDGGSRSRQIGCRDNRSAVVPVPIRGLTPETHTNNIVGEEHTTCPGGEESSSASTHRLPLVCLPGSSTDPAGLEDTNEEICELKEYMFEDKLKKVRKEPLDRVMIWNECEAYFHQMKPVLSAPCGPMAVLNMLKALGRDVDREEVSKVILSRPRDETAPIPEYLFSRGVAGTTAEALIEGVVQLTKGEVIGRFFQFYPPRDVELLKWLAYWIKKGAVPIATLNLQKSVRGSSGIPDAWHHQMVYGVSSKGVHLTNPLEILPEEVILEQLFSESVLLVQRQDIVSRYNDHCQLYKFLQQPDSRWQTMNVLGQVVNVLREETKIPGYRAQVTSHVSIPAIYLSGITLYLPEDSPSLGELTTVPNLPIATPPTTSLGTSAP